MNKTMAWYIHSIGGLVLTGLGLSIIGEAIILKMSSEGIWPWVVTGTLGLVLFNTGLALVAKAAVLLAELRRQKRRERHRKKSLRAGESP